MKSKINLKLDLSMLNTILMVVVLILVIVACVRRYRENFDTCYITPNENKTDGEWYEGDKGFKCEGSGRWADGGSFGADESWDLDAMTSIKDWAESDDPLHESWVYGDVRIDIQLTQSGQYLFHTLDKILKALNIQGDSAAEAVKKVKKASKQYVGRDENDNPDYSRANLKTIKEHITSSGYYDGDAETLILKLKKSNDNVKKLIKDNPEKTDGKIDNDKRDTKQTHWDDLQGGISDTYNIMDNGEPINFLDQFSKLIDEEQLLLDFVNKIINKLGPKHKAIALGTIGVVPTTQA
jgi:hypothetical protein